MVWFVSSICQNKTAHTTSFIVKFTMFSANEYFIQFFKKT